MRPIDADKLLKDIEQYHLSDGFFQHWVEVQPTIEPEQKKGKWIGKPIAGYATVRCSACNDVFCENTGRWNYCPNCGAKMGDMEKSNPCVSQSDIVRCHECEFNDTSTHTCEYSAVYVHPNGFCHWGRKKETIVS